MKERSFGSLGWGTMYSLSRRTLSIVIPGWPEGPGPESILPDGGYGFRARRFAAPRNDGLRLVRIEALFQPLPAIRIVVLQRARLGRMRGDALGKARLEHEGHGAGE